MAKEVKRLWDEFVGNIPHRKAEEKPFDQKLQYRQRDYEREHQRKYEAKRRQAKAIPGEKPQEKKKQKVPNSIPTLKPQEKEVFKKLGIRYDNDDKRI